MNLSAMKKQSNGVNRLGMTLSGEDLLKVILKILGFLTRIGRKEKEICDEENDKVKKDSETGISKSYIGKGKQTY